MAIQAPCHLRAQKIAFPSVPVLEALGAEVELVQECSAVDGTWGMKAQYYDLGRRYALKMVRGMNESEADHFVTDCPLSALRIAKETGKTCMHPIEAVALALELESTREGVPEGAHVSAEASDETRRDHEEDRP